MKATDCLVTSDASYLYQYTATGRFSLVNVIVRARDAVVIAVHVLPHDWKRTSVRAVAVFETFYRARDSLQASLNVYLLHSSFSENFMCSFVHGAHFFSSLL